MTTVRTATIGDLDPVASVLAHAFFDDPIMTWALGPDDRLTRLTGLWRVIGAGYLMRGGCTSIESSAGPSGADTGNTADAAALWMPPGERLDDEFWESNGADLAAAVGDGAERLGQLSAAMAEHHPGDDHWYLLAIGVAPSMHGCGLGSTLLSHSTELAFKAGAPAYLEATSRRSRLLYERHGFETISEFTAVDSPPIWGMWRAA